MATLPNIVLVHGAWGNAAHWNKVILPLHRKGYRVSAAENPLTSLADDAERTRRLFAPRRTARWCWSATPTAPR